MAQSSAGIKLYYGQSTDGKAKPATWTEIPDVTAIPALGGEPNMLDCTPLSETVQKQYIPGLKDPGGALGYTVNMTPDMLTATDAASTPPTTPAKIAFAVEFPAPLNCHYWYFGSGVNVTPGETEVDAVVTSTFYTSVESTITKVTGPVTSSTGN